MTRNSSIVALAVLLTLAGAGSVAAAQQQPTRASDQQVADLLTRMHADISWTAAGATTRAGRLNRRRAHCPPGSGRPPTSA